MKKFALFSGLTALLLPLTTFAQLIEPNTGYVQSWIDAATKWLGTAVVAIMVLLTIMFLVNIIRYVSEKDATKLKDRRKAMFNALIGLFVAVSVWGIIRLAGSILGTNGVTGQAGVCPAGMTYSSGICH